MHLKVCRFLKWHLKIGLLVTLKLLRDWLRLFLIFFFRLFKSFSLDFPLVFGDNELLHLLLEQCVITCLMFPSVGLYGWVKYKLYEVLNSLLLKRCFIRFPLNFFLYQAGSVKVFGVIFLPIHHKLIVVNVSILLVGELNLSLLIGQLGGNFEVKLLGWVELNKLLLILVENYHKYV